MTKTQLAQELAIEAGEQFDDIDVKSQFEDWVQQAVDAVYALSPWFFRNNQELIQCNPAQRVYSIATGTARIRDIQLAGGGRVAYAPVERLIARGKNLDTQAIEPEFWYFEGVGTSNELKIGIQPVPSGVVYLNVHGVKRPPTLAASDTIPLPDEYLNAVRSRCRMLLAMSDRDYNAAGIFEQSFQQQMQLLSEQFAGLVRPVSRLRVKGSEATYQSPQTPGGK